MPKVPGERAVRLMRRRTQAFYNRSRPKFHQFYSSQSWRHLRAMYIQEHPLCESCLSQGMTVSGVIVDHIIELADGGAALDVSNLQTLCQSCHNRKTAATKRGRGASNLQGDAGRQRDGARLKFSRNEKGSG